MAYQEPAFNPLTDEDRTLFDSYKEAISAKLYETFPEVPAGYKFKPVSVRQQLGCGTFYTYKVTLPGDQTAEVAFHLGGKRATPLVGPPHFEITKSN